MNQDEYLEALVRWTNYAGRWALICIVTLGAIILLMHREAGQ